MVKKTIMEYKDNNARGAYTIEYFNQYENTINNGEARIPICICVDTSESMENLLNPKDQLERDPNSKHFVDGQEVYYAKIKPGFKKITCLSRLQEVLSDMLSNMKRDDIISKSAVICILTFNQFADCYVEFTDINMINVKSPYGIEIGRDQTNISKGIKMALDRIDQQIVMNSNAGNDSYKPVLIIMSDGSPTDGAEAEKAKELVRQRSEDNKLNVIPIFIGNNVSGMNWLKGLSRKSVAYQMKCLKDYEDVFAEIKERIHRTATVVSADEDENNCDVVPEGIDNSSYGTAPLISELEDFLNQ